MSVISPRAARAIFDAGREFAFIDVREIVDFGRGHPFLAANLPWSELELHIRERVPRSGTPVVLSDGCGELAPRAARRLRCLGFDDVSVLDGGAQAWREAGFGLVPEIEVPAKGFGAFARIHGRPRYISPRELHRRISDEDGWVVLDSRPVDEYRRGAIPGSINVPGPDVLRHFEDLAPDPATKVVVNCMSATRGTLGGLSLMAAGVPNEVHVLHHGTRGWLLEGLELERGAGRVPPAPSPGCLARARERAAALRERVGITELDGETLVRWQADPARTTYLFDVRSQSEYDARHVAGARSAPEGRLVLSVEDFLATRNARIVLVDDPDDDGVRATVTALWLAQMGMGEVAVLTDPAGVGFDAGERPSVARDAALGVLQARFPAESIDVATLRARLTAGTASLVDLGTSAAYCEGHVPQARWMSRRAAIEALPAGPVIYTSEDGVRALLGAADAIEAGHQEVSILAGGNAAWAASGQALVSGEDGLAGPRVDHWLAASERPGEPRRNVIAYLDWETQLLDEIHAAGERPYRNLLW